MSERLLPFNASSLEQVLEEVIAARINAIPLPINTLWRPATCPSALLPWLAWALSVETWESDWPDEIKRAVIAGSMVQHRHKGSVAAVRQALDEVGVPIRLIEWFEVGGQPHTFQVEMNAVTHWIDNGQAIDPDIYHTIPALIDSVKPLRSHYRMRINIAAANSLGLANHARQFALLRGRLPLIIPLQAALGFATAVRRPSAYVSHSLILSNPTGLSRLAPLAFSIPLQAVLHKRLQQYAYLTPRVLPTITLLIHLPIRSMTTQVLSMTISL